MKTVIHYNRVTARWHVETDGPSAAPTLWTADEVMATRLAEGYRAHGYDTRVIPAEGVTILTEGYSAPYIEYAD